MNEAERQWAKFFGRLTIIAIGLLAVLVISVAGCSKTSDEMLACGKICERMGVKSFTMVTDLPARPVCVCNSPYDGGGQ